MVRDVLELDRVRRGLTGAATAWRIEHHREVRSTMDIARQRAISGASSGTVVVAESQSAGRGRLGRSWLSLPGVNLYFTVLLRPSLPLLRKLAMVTPLAIAEAIEAVTALQPEIKWPNDLQIGGLKCSGILIDSEVRGDCPAYALVGIGINVNLDLSTVPELAEIGTSLAAVLKRSVSREDILAAALSRLAALCHAVEHGESVQQQWKARLDTLGRRVQVTSAGGIEKGVVEDVDEDGSIVLRRIDGSLTVISAGDVTLRA